MANGVAVLSKEITELQAKIKRYEEALRLIADKGCHSVVRQIARTALDEK